MSSENGKTSDSNAIRRTSYQPEPIRLAFLHPAGVKMHFGMKKTGKDGEKMQHCIREERRQNEESTKLLLKIKFFNDFCMGLLYNI